MAETERRHPWIVMGPEPFMMSCERCGATKDKPSMPIGLWALIAGLERFAAAHTRCTEAS